MSESGTENHKAAEPDNLGTCAEEAIQAGTGLRRRTVALYSVAGFSLIYAWYVVLTDPTYRFNLQRLLSLGNLPVAASSLPDASIHEADDPPIGTQLPRKGPGAELRRAALQCKNGYLLAALGDCESCTQLSLPKLFQQTKERKIVLLAFSTENENEIRSTLSSLRRDGIEIPIIRDPDKKLSKVLNSYYPGRLYFFTSDWKLRWRERDLHIDNYLFSTGRFDRLMENTAP